MVYACDFILYIKGWKLLRKGCYYKLQSQYLGVIKQNIIALEGTMPFTYRSLRDIKTYNFVIKMSRPFEILNITAALCIVNKNSVLNKV